MLLEEELGEQLLERSVRSVRITAAGEIVYEKARSILAGERAESHFAAGAATPAAAGRAALVQRHRQRRIRDALAPQLPRTDLYIQEMWTGRSRQ